MKASDILNKYKNANLEEIANQSPDVISAELVFLTANLWQAGSLVMEAEQKLAVKWMELRSLVETDGQADKRIKAEKEYKELAEAKCADKCVIELIRSLKKLLSSKADEFKATF